MFFQICVLLLIWTSSTTSSPQSQYSNLVDSNDLGPYKNVVAATNFILPEIADVFDKINRDARLDIDPFSPEGIRDAVLAFLPVSRSVLLAAAHAEGRKVTQDDLDRLAKMEEDLPLAFDYVSSLKNLKQNVPSAGSIQIASRRETIPIPNTERGFNISPQQQKPTVISSAAISKVNPNVYEKSQVDATVGNLKAHSTRVVGNEKSTQNINVRNGFPIVQDIFGRSAIDVVPTVSSRVLRGTSKSDYQEPHRLQDSRTFIKLPYSQAVFVRHSTEDENGS